MLTPGGTLGGRYRLDERIATGGMGDVWKAEDTVLGRVVAVKILQSALLQEPGFIERFRAEARVMATINHAGVVRVYDYGETAVDGGGQVAYLVMEYVEGEPLSQTLGRVGRLTPERTMNLLAQAGEALAAAHEHGIVHRDVKPGNLLVRPDGRLVLTDFGIARSAMSGQLTTAGSILGTASYVSPEQATGNGDITPASDVYSLGVVGYQCLSGRRPFEGDNPLQVAMKHVRDVPAPLPADVPGAVRQVVERAMSKDPVQRWPGAQAMADASRRAASGGPATGALGGTSRMGGPDRTSVMPHAAPTSGPGTGNYNRGAAAVPSGPPYGAVPAEGYTTQAPPPRRKGNGLLVAGVVLAVVVALAGLAGIAYALLNDDNGTPNDHAGNGQASHSPSASAQSNDQGGDQNGDQGNDRVITLPDQGNAYLHKPYAEAARDVRSRGLRPVRRVGALSPLDYQPGDVNRVKYESPLHENDPVYLYVEPRFGGGNNGGNDNSGGTDNGGGNNGGGDGTGSSQSPSASTPSTDTTPSANVSPAVQTSDNQGGWQLPMPPNPPGPTGVLR